MTNDKLCQRHKNIKQEYIKIGIIGEETEDIVKLILDMFKIQNKILIVDTSKEQSFLMNTLKSRSIINRVDINNISYTSEKRYFLLNKDDFDIVIFLFDFTINNSLLLEVDKLYLISKNNMFYSSFYKKLTRVYKNEIEQISLQEYKSPITFYSEIYAIAELIYKNIIMSLIKQKDYKDIRLYKWVM